MRKAALIVGIAVGHFVLSMALMVYAMRASMGRFEHGGLPGLGERAVSITANVLLFPLVQPLGHYLLKLTASGPPWEHMIFAANSILWATVLVVLASRYAKRVPSPIAAD